MFEDTYYMDGFDEENQLLPFVTITDNDEEHEEGEMKKVLPILALKNTVLFPGIIIPITVGRERSIKAINKAYQDDKYIAVLTQKDVDIEDPEFDDLHQVGTIAYIVKTLRMPDGTITAIIQGKRRFELGQLLQDTPFLRGEILPRPYEFPENEATFNAITSSISDTAKQIVELSPHIPSEALVMLSNINSAGFLLNFIASNLKGDVEEKQFILEIDDLMEKANVIYAKIESELELLELKDQIENKVRSEIDKHQRDYYLNQQLKTIQEELGQDPQQEQLNELELRSHDKKWPEHAAKAFGHELTKLRRMNPQSPDFNVLLNYVELMLDLPWDHYSKDNFKLQKVKKTLDKDHFGLEKVKERILEHLAVLKLKGDMKSPILCLVGPPGVGKTSLGKSIAKALNRTFVRMSLGGLHDESEIRGHRKTYIGAMPGRVIQSLKKAETSNPVFILDEIDKVGKDFRGDPSSALLEVLDPEQNSTFHDNYLDLEYDLSKVFFIATANSLNSLQPALLDRMEVIEIGGYSTEEKIEIAKKHLIPKQLKEHGLKASQVKLSSRTLEYLIENYTRESGVRALNRRIAAVMRRAAKHVAMEEEYSANVKLVDVPPILGPTRYSKDRYQKLDTSGVAIGLAWTPVGGDILFIEVSLSKGSGKLTLTGNLGDVMKESATTALSFLKANSEKFDIDAEVFKSKDVHIHVPEGAIPKDGPSAGITMLTALTSSFTNRLVRPHLAMTGEITLRGKVLPVGGIKEKVLAAKRAGLTDIILCSENKKHIEEIEADYIKKMEFHYVNTMQQVLGLALA